MKVPVGVPVKVAGKPEPEGGGGRLEKEPVPDGWGGTPEKERFWP